VFSPRLEYPKWIKRNPEKVHPLTLFFLKKNCDFLSMDAFGTDMIAGTNSSQGQCRFLWQKKREKKIRHDKEITAVLGNYLSEGLL
jgi:hypothetical protein